ncbi:MAG: hypothetical protein A2177_07360 [Spirochaetes bacterium RBG_13_68_11]|nr:MAG: hypothetical protein A2177_07360 [Spirochaetes bacterium RBG_13_68_11]
MTEFRLLFRFLDKEFLFRLIFILLLYSIVPIAEIFLFLWLGEVIGNYLILAIAAVVGLLGMLFALREVRVTLERLRARIRRHEYPGSEFVDLAGILAGAILLLTPGFITDFVGFLLLIPFFRRALGRLVTRRMDRSLHEVYEYLQLSDID